MLHAERSRRWLTAAMAAAGFTATAVLVAFAGRAPLSHSGPVTATSARAPVTALFVLGLGAGIVALAGLLTVLWPRRHGLEEPEWVSNAPAGSWWVRLLALALPFALAAVVIAAAFTGVHGARPVSVGRARVHLPPAGGHRAGGGAAGGFSIPGWLPWTVLGLVLGALLLGAAVLAGRRRSPAASEQRPAVEAALGAAAARLRDLSDPRLAVIAAYEAMEQTLAAHGVERSAHQAPREYLRRVLSVAVGSERDAATLTSRFEEARFSTHPISERVRSEAISALDSLRRRLALSEARSR